MATVSVGSGSELVDAIQTYGSGDVIDATQVSDVDVPSGTTLEGDGVTVSIDEPGTVFRQLADDVTYRGIDFEGHRVEEIRDDGWWDYPDEDGAWDHASAGIGIFSSSCLVEACSFAGFTFAGVFMGQVSDGTQWTPTIRDCTFEDNNARGLGYGVAVYSGYPVIEWCYFNNNRHDVAGGGDNDTCGYEARYNHIGEYGRIYGMEMHAPGGLSVHIHHNTFEHKVSTQTGEDRSLVVNRGTPAEECQVHNNWFKNPDRDEVVTLLEDAPDYYAFSDNHFGPDEPSGDIGQPNDPDSGGPPTARYSIPRTRLREISLVLEEH